MMPDNPAGPKHVHPFWEGQYAREKGKSEYDCPWPSDSWERDAWLHGREERGEMAEDSE